MNITFLKDSQVNKAQYKKGASLNVSESIRDRLLKSGQAEDTKPKASEKGKNK